MNELDRKIKNYLQTTNIRNKSANDIAKELFVSRTRIYKVCRLMGYRSFTKLKYDLANVEEKQSVHTDIEFYLANIDLANINNIIEATLNAKTIYLVGTNATSIVCEYFYRQLINMNIFAVSLTDYVLFKHYKTIINEDDIVFSFSNSGETEQLICFLTQIKGVKVAVTKPNSTIYNISKLQIGVDTKVNVLDEGFDKEDVFALILIVQNIAHKIHNIRRNEE